MSRRRCYCIQRGDVTVHVQAHGEMTERDFEAIDAVIEALHVHKQKGKSMNEQETETEIKAKGLTAPRITPEQIDAKIASEDYHVFPGSQTTICCLTLVNGFTVTGESACASPANFNEELGRKIARGHARDKIWALEGYLLKQNLSETAKQVA